MKKLLLITGLLLSFTASADLIDDPHGDVSLFIGTESGLIIDAGSENFRFEVIAAEDPGFGLKYAFNPNQDFKIWLGLGKTLVKNVISDNSGNWKETSFTNTDSLSVVFAEVVFKSNYFIRVSHYDSEQSAIFSEFDGSGNVIDQKTITEELKENLIWIGYKFNF